jgi:DNA transformation protein
MSAEYEDFLRDLFKPFGEITFRRMFGGLGVYHNATILAIAGDDILYLKVDDINRPAFEAAGSAPFSYSRGEKNFSMSYWQVPETLLDDPDEFMGWARNSYEAALRTEAAKAGKKSRKKNRLPMD